jgi:hypothetical protein
MFSRSASLFFAAALLAAPAALAQHNNPTGNEGSNRSVTASPGTADSHAASGANTADTHGFSNYGGSGASSSTMPSHTTPGNNSSVAGNSSATGREATGTSSGSGGGATR